MLKSYALIQKIWSPVRMQRRHMPVWKPICNYVENDYRCKLVEIIREHSTPVRDASRTSVNLEQVTDEW